VSSRIGFEGQGFMITNALWKVLRKRLGPAPRHPTVKPTAAWPVTASSPTAAGAADSSGYDSQFDSRQDVDALDAKVLQNGHHAVIQQVLRGRADALLPAYSASYGADANLVFDFHARLAFVDPQAQRQLRVHRELPQPAPGARTQGDAIVRELDETLWDIGIAAGPHPLLDAPGGWWRTPLHWAVDARVERYSRIPRHIDLARCLIERPASPSDLRRYAHVSLADLRSFIQAGLMLGLMAWGQAADFAPTQRLAH
jgi:hypothetical protein